MWNLFGISLYPFWTEKFFSISGPSGTKILGVYGISTKNFPSSVPMGDLHVILSLPGLIRNLFILYPIIYRLNHLILLPDCIFSLRPGR